MRDDLIDQILDGRFFGIAHLVAAALDRRERIFQKLDDVAVFLSSLERDWSDELVTTLIRLCKRVRELREPLVEFLERLVLAVAAGRQMSGMGDIARQKKMSDEFVGFHMATIPRCSMRV